MKSIAIITARGGSKRIPRKNIKDFCGKPIIGYSIDAAIASGLFDEVMVSTDDEEIADIAKKFGAKVPFYRTEKTSNDFATTSDVLEEVIYMYGEKGMEFDVVCCIYPTAPFVTSEKLKEAMSIFAEKNASGVIPVVRYSFPPQRAFVLAEEHIVFQYPENEKKRSQDLEPIYHDCGQFYILKTSELLQHHTIVPQNAYPYFVSELEAQDIDNILDWKLAELKYNLVHNDL